MYFPSFVFFLLFFFPFFLFVGGPVSGGVFGVISFVMSFPPVTNVEYLEIVKAREKELMLE